MAFHECEDRAIDNPQSIETEINLVFFLKTLKEVIDRPNEMLNVKNNKIMESKIKSATAVIKLFE